MQTLHPESHQTQRSDDLASDLGNKRCGSATSVPRGVDAPDLMVIGMTEGRELVIHADYLESHDNYVVEVRLSPTGEHLSDLADTLRTIADKLDAHHAAFCHERQARVDAMRTIIERLQAMSDRDQRQVWRVFDDSPF